MLPDTTIRILIIDDDREDADLVLDLLADVRDWTPEVTVATSYEAGLARFAQNGFDACLLDYELGARTGIDFLREPVVAESTVPIVMLTGHRERSVDLAALEAGAVDYLQKAELNLPRLDRAIRYAHERRRRQRTEARFEALQANSREALALVDADSTVRWASPAFKRVLGRQPEERVGLNGLLEVHPDDRDRVAREFQALLDDPSHVAHVQYRVRHADGSWRVLRSWIENYLDDPDVGGILAGSWDVTEWVAREEEVRFQARLLGEVSQAVIATDLDGRVTYWNRAAEHLYGWAADEAIGMPITDLTPGETSRAQAEAIMTALRTGGSWSGEFPVRRRDGSRFTALVSNAPILGTDGRQQGIIGVSSDISHLKRTELALRERVKEMGALFRTAQIVNRHDRSEDDRLREVVESIPAGWLRPEATTARVVLADKIIAGTGFRETEWMLSAPIPLSADDGARLEVALLEYRADGGEPPFLPEECELIRTLASTIGEALERDRVTRLHRQTVACMDEAVLVLDLHEGGRLVRDANPAAERIFGMPRRELLGMDKAQLHACEEGVHRFGEREVALLLAGESIRTAHPMRRRDGETFAAEQMVALLDPAKGFEGGMVSVIRDVSAQQRAEAELREAQERFGVLSREISDVIYVVDADGLVQYTSPSIEAATGYTGAEFVGMNGLMLVHPDDRGRIGQALASLRDDPGGTMRAEYRVLTRDGTVLEVESVARNLLQHPAVRGIVVTSRDITERLALERQFRQTQKMEAVGRLAGGIAHDFNNILTVIRSQSDLLLMESENDRLLGEIGLIRASADRAARLTRQLLAFSREQMLRPEVVDLGELVSGMGAMLERILGEDIAIEYDLAPRLPPVEIDPGQLEQVVLNLAVNARDAMPDGGRLSLRARQVANDPDHPLEGCGDGPCVLLSVADSGAGIPKEVRARIFEPFFTTKEPGKGTGLGLSMAYGFMNQSGGSIWVESAPGAGATFHLCFPSVTGAVTHPAVAPEPTAAGVEMSGTVLLVEDDPAVRRVAQRILERAGLRVHAANDAEAGLHALTNGGAISVVLTDLVLPGMGGRALIDRIQQTAPQIPLVAMSGYAPDAILKRGGLPRGVGFVQKPFTPGELIGAVREAMQER